MRTLIVIALVAGLAPSRAVAQAPRLESQVEAAAALDLVARRAAPLPLPTPSFRADLAVARRHGPRATGETLMIIGGAAVVVGLVAGGGGGNFLVVGGVVCAGAGFYIYEQ